jgi:hypothetical protein
MLAIGQTREDVSKDRAWWGELRPGITLVTTRDLLAHPYDGKTSSLLRPSLQSGKRSIEVDEAKADAKNCLLGNLKRDAHSL